MKLYLIAPALVLVGLVACSKETSAPASQAADAEAPAATAAPQADALADLPDQITAEEIQARREAWVSSRSGSNAGADSNTTASNADAAASRVAAAPAPSRE